MPQVALLVIFIVITSTFYLRVNDRWWSWWSCYTRWSQFTVYLEAMCLKKMLVQISEGCGPGWGISGVSLHSNVASSLALQTPTSLYRCQKENERQKGKEEKKETSEKKCDIAKLNKSNHSIYRVIVQYSHGIYLPSCCPSVEMVLIKRVGDT